MKSFFTVVGLIVGFFVAYGIIHLGKALGANIIFLGTVFKTYFWCMLIFGGMGFFIGLIRAQKKPKNTDKS